MPDDRFADLGQGTRAGDRFAELDELHPEPRPPAPRRRGRYTWVVGVAAVIAIGVVSINSLPNAKRGDEGPAVGKPLPKFAAPSATGPLAGDPNINQSRSDPAPGDTPACDVHEPGALRSCDYVGKPLVITFIAPTAACEDFVDRVERMRSRFRGVNFLTVMSAAGKAKAAALVAQRGWRQPVAVDDNGAVLTLYRVSFCATVVFARRGGTVRATKTTAQSWTDAQLAAAIQATVRR